LSHIKNTAAAMVIRRERRVLIVLTPLRNSDVLFDVDEAFCFSKRGEVLVSILLVYSQTVNVPRRKS
jgi:hypothetical protein